MSCPVPTVQYLTRRATRGDSYAFRMTFPAGWDLAAEIASGPTGEVLAQVRKGPESPEIAATWTVLPSVAVDPPYLDIYMTSVDLVPGTWLTDVQVGTETYLKMQEFNVDPDISRPVAP